MEAIYERPKSIMEGAISGFCPGCIHATVHKIIAEVIDEMGLLEKSVRVSGIGCLGNGNMYQAGDIINSPHGRACAVASGLKRSNPNLFVYTYQGDGDLAAIGLGETLSAAARGENFPIIFLNNSTYGMTGGQLAPTTLIGMEATTTPHGRTPEEHGYPIHVCELLDSLKAPRYLARVTCTTPKGVRETRNAIRKAFQNEVEGKGFSLVEVLCNCPTNWHMTPLESLDFINNVTSQEYKLGVIRDI